MGLQGLFHRSIFCIKQFVQFVAQFIAAAVANEGGYDIAIAVEQYFGRESGDAELLNGQLFSIGENSVNIALQSSNTSRKRMVVSVYRDSTIYSYDILGNVKTLVQHVKALVAVDVTNGKNRIDYDYDLVSGKVNKVSCQPGKGDQFFPKFSYDADNRIISTYTSRDELIWNEDATYLY
jgi:hypothetical protein